MFIDGTDETDNLNLPFHSEYRHTVYINSGAVRVSLRVSVRAWLFLCIYTRVRAHVRARVFVCVHNYTSD